MTAPPVASVLVRAEIIDDTLLLYAEGEPAADARAVAAALPHVPERATVVCTAEVAGRPDLFALLPGLLVEHLAGLADGIRLVPLGPYADRAAVPALARALGAELGLDQLTVALDPPGPVPFPPDFATKPPAAARPAKAGPAAPPVTVATALVDEKTARPPERTQPPDRTLTPDRTLLPDRTLPLSAIPKPAPDETTSRLVALAGPAPARPLSAAKTTRLTAIPRTPPPAPTAPRPAEKTTRLTVVPTETPTASEVPAAATEAPTAEAEVLPFRRTLPPPTPAAPDREPEPVGDEVAELLTARRPAPEPPSLSLVAAARPEEPADPEPHPAPAAEVSTAERARIVVPRRRLGRDHPGDDLRKLLAGRYDAYSRVAARILAEEPGLRVAAQTAPDLLAGLIAVRAYGTAERAAVNAALRGAADPRAEALAAWIAYGLHRLPAVFGPVFRTVAELPSDAYRKGTVVTEPAFLDGERVRPAPTGPELVIWSAGARRVGRLTDGDLVLFPPGSSFEVLEAEPDRVYLRELPGGRPAAGGERLAERLAAVPPGAAGPAIDALTDLPGLDEHGRIYVTRTNDEVAS
ncbi:hypothetical protein [Paractinoplanes durhamensis]|uniref:Basic proline-rich protein n=1 Tax=Paractinoplanes durhamensis TaxID=113563 RepID=A0ABQ3Z2X2_9ACTN|nr:hypothetical protein [Actinoplanes durhamensis]GIE04174.1 hypothetical protein Adu01nite_55240 [Actinoplanes durhamensis]